MSAGIAKAIAAIGRGEVVIVTDDEDRENEGDLIMAADAVTTESLAFFLEHTSGVVCVALPGPRLDELELPLMVSDNQEGAAHGVHGDGRSRSRDHDGHLGLRSRANAPRARRPSRRGRRLRPPGPHPPAAQPARRRARARRAHGGRRRPRAACRAPAGWRALRGRHRRPACDGAAVRARGARRRAWAADGERRRAQAPPAAHRAAHPAGGRGARAHPARDLQLPGVALGRSTASITSRSSRAIRAGRTRCSSACTASA